MLGPCASLLIAMRLELIVMRLELIAGHLKLIAVHLGPTTLAAF